MKREEVERRVKEDTESYSDKFSAYARLICSQVCVICFIYWLKYNYFDLFVSRKNFTMNNDTYNKLNLIIGHKLIVADILIETISLR